MSTLENELVVELAIPGPVRHLIAVSDLAARDDAQREEIHGRFRGQTYPLLQDARWVALQPYSPVLIATSSENFEGHRSLLEGFRGRFRDTLDGWIISLVPATELAVHLSHAIQAKGPDGDSYLLRYYDPVVLPVLYKHADPVWWRAFTAPIVSWWIPRADTKLQRWGRVPGAGIGKVPPPAPLTMSDTLWQALAGDPFPHRLLQATEAHEPPLFDTDCRGIRLARVQEQLDAARARGLSSHDDLCDYVFMALSQGVQRLDADRHWQSALQWAASGKGRLGDTYLALCRRQT